ncbi:drug/metabolite transporter (DMT)-like permease [Devosia sp. UYZn731]|uniref:DMT family transporter n=1 Tax=Devosia sp. UYZn731 TaxID=3156345 RepID=UPI00339B618E
MSTIPSTSVRPTSSLPAFAVAGTVVSWAASFPAIGLALGNMDPLPMASVRFALAAVISISWLLWRRPALPARGDIAVLVVCGVLGIAVYNVLLNLGQKSVSPGAASFIINCQPILMAILAVVFLRETFNRWSWLGAVLGFAGLSVVAWGQPGGLHFGAGSSLIFGAAFATAIFSVLQRPLLARIEPLSVASMVLTIGALALLPWLPAGIAQFSAAGVPAKSAVLFLAIAPAAIGQMCWSYAIRHYGAARAGQFLYLIPPLATLLTWVLLGDVPALTTIAGGLIASWVFSL